MARRVFDRSAGIVRPPGEVVVSVRPPSVYANAPAAERERLRGLLRGRGRTVVRAVMVLLSLHGLSPAQIAVLVEYDPATVRRWIGRFYACGVTGLADRPP